MKWAIVTQYWPVREQPYRGHSAYQTVRRLLNRVEVQAFAPQASYPSWLVPRNRPWAKTDNTFQPADVRTTYFDYPALPVLSRFFNGDVCAGRLEPQIRAFAPDLILSYWVYPDAYAAVKVGKKLGIPVVTTPIGTDLNRSLKGFTRSFTSWTLNNSDLVITVSHDLADTAVELGAHRSKVLPILNGCDTNIFFPKEQAESRRLVGMRAEEQSILYVGRLDVLKGLQELVTACAELASSRAELRLTMVGEGPAKPIIEQLAAKLGFANRLRMVAPCPSTMVAEWMNATDVFALPSYAEGCPNVVVEALNCGRPVVASRVGGIPELVNQSKGILIPSKDAKALAIALNQALNTNWNHQAIGDSSRRSWEDTANELFNACEKLVKPSLTASGARHEITASR
jgi:glycosyltransferase involved in cell wall biosynthesis